MAMQQGQSSLFGKHSKDVMKAHHEAVSKEPEVFGSDLPPGIKNGVARLVKCEIVKHKGKDEKDPNNGQPEFVMAAVCIEPVVFNNVQCKGKQFRLNPPIPLYETPKWKSGGSFIEHYNRMLDYLRIYVGKDVWQESGYFAGDNPQQIEANLIRCMKDLSEKGPHFSFTTAPGRKQQLENKGGRIWLGANSYSSEEEAKEKNPWLDRDPRTQVNWGDLLPNYSEGNNGAAAFNDQSANGQETADDEGTLTPENEFEDQPVISNEPSDEEEEVDLDEYVAKAPKDEAIREKFIKLAEQFGIDREAAEGADTWDDLKDMILAAQAADQGAAVTDEEPEEVQEPPSPSKGDVGRYQLLDAKGNPLKDKSKKIIPPVNVEVLTVNTKNSTVTLKNLEAGGKTIVGADGKPLHVAWDKLLPSE